MSMRIEQVMVTPTLAAEWLKKNVNNRQLSPSHVGSIQRDIEEDRWQLTHQAVAFYEDGSLADGQHRLAAVVQANKPVKMHVCFDMPKIAAESIDTGRVRRAADNGKILYNIQRAPLRYALASVYIALDRAGQAKSIPDFTVKLTHSELHEVVMSKKDELDWIVSKGREIRPAGLAGTLLYAYAGNPEKVDKFAEMFVSKVGIPKGSPVLAALVVQRRVSQGAVASSRTKADLCLRVARCVEAYLKDEALEIARPSLPSLLYLAKLRSDRGADE